MSASQSDIAQSNDVEHMVPVPSGYFHIGAWLYLATLLYTVGFLIASIAALCGTQSTWDMKSPLSVEALPLVVFAIGTYGYRRACRWSLIPAGIALICATSGIGIVAVEFVPAPIGGPVTRVIVFLGIFAFLWLVIIGAFLAQRSFYAFFWHVKGRCPLCGKHRLGRAVSVGKTWHCPQLQPDAEMGCGEGVTGTYRLSLQNRPLISASVYLTGLSCRQELSAQGAIRPQAR